jgi:thiamine-phosphate pyrophosphorylase
VVTNDEVARLPQLSVLARAVARTGPVAIHARAPGLEGRALLDLAQTLREAARSTSALLFVNDRLDVARICGAPGLHLPARGLPTARARELLGPDVLIGRSAHSADEAREAGRDGADYVFLGPIWPTPSHPRGSRPLGPEAIAAAHPARVIAIGGVTLERARLCRAAGAYGVAAISAIWQAPDPGGAAAEMLLPFSESSS